MKVEIFDDGAASMQMTRAEFKEYLDYQDGIKEGKEKPTEPVGILASFNPERGITNIMSRLGLPRNIQGFGYLREAIALSVGDWNYLNNVTKKLYPAVASKFRTTPLRVERSIRHCVERSWNQAMVTVLNEICGTNYTLNSYKPTNSELIALLVDHLKINGWAA